jgi:hypothetical protein
MKLKTPTFRALLTPRATLRALGIIIALTALAAFLHASEVLPLEATWPAVGRAIPPLGEWRQISALLLVALGIVIQFMLPEKRPDGLPIRQGVEETDTRWAEKRQTGWMLVLSVVLVAAWVGILELLSRGLVSPGGRVLILTAAVLIQSAGIFWLLRYVGRRQKRLLETHGAKERQQCPRYVRALLSPGVGFLLGVGTLGLWMGLLLAISRAWPQTISLPPAAENHGALPEVMRLTADELLDTVLFGIPAKYGLVLGQPRPHSGIGATILVIFRLTAAASLFLMLYLTIKARRLYAQLTRRMLRESSEEASEALAAIGRPTGKLLAREALRLRTWTGGDADQPPAKTLLLNTMYSFYHPRIVDFALREANDSDASDSDRVEALKYVCTYGDRQTALGLLGRFFHSGNPDLREGVSLICVAFQHPDCDGLLDEIGREPQAVGEYRNAVIGAGVRLAGKRADRSGVASCLEALPSLLRSSDPYARQMLEGMSMLAAFAAQEVEKEIQAAWQDMPGGTKLYCLEIILKIRAGLLPDPEFLRSVLSNTELERDGTESDGLWRYIMQEDVASLVEISQGQDMLARDEALAALSKIRANRTDLVVNMPLPAEVRAPADERDLGSLEAGAPETGWGTPKTGLRVR